MNKPASAIKRKSIIGAACAIGLVAASTTVTNAGVPALGSTAASATPPTGNIIIPAGGSMPTATRDTATASQAAKPIKLGLNGAILLALRQNPQILVQRYGPALAQNAIEAQRAVYDPQLSAGLSGGNSRGGSSGGYATNNSLNGYFSAQQLFPTGTTVQAGVNSSLNNGENSGESDSTSLSLTVTQALLNGGSIQANLAAIHEAELGRRISDYNLQGVALSIASQVEKAYWNYALAITNIGIVEDALDVAEEQEQQTRELIRVGRTAGSQLPAAVAQVALERESLINAQGNLKIARITLLSLISPPHSAFWRRTVTLINLPTPPRDLPAPVAAHVKLALKLSPLINETRLQIQQNDLQVVQTRNGLLPKLDVFITLGKTGYANSFGQAIGNLHGSDYQALAGVTYNYPLFNRAPRAAYNNALLTRDQQEAALANLVQQVQLAVRSDYITTETDREQISATHATSLAQAEALRSEIGQFRVGATTSLQVAVAQSNLLSAKLAEAQAVVAYLNARSQLYLEEGSLLERHGVASPGSVPLQISGPSWLRRWPDGYFAGPVK